MRDGRKMARKYLFSLRFVIDLLSTIPFDIMFQSVVSNDVQAFLAALGMLKLFRASRISTIIARLKYNREVKAFYKLLQLIATLILYLHITGCIFFFVARQKKVWVPPVDYILGGTTLYTANIAHQYWISFYHVTCLFGINEILPNTSAEYAFCALMMLISAIVLANSLGQIALLVAQLSEKHEKYQEQIDLANTAMENINLSGDLIKEVVFFLLSTQTTQDSQEEFKSFLNHISPSLNAQVKQEIF